MKVETADIEVFPSFFCICFTDFYTREKKHFRISTHENDSEKLYTYLYNNNNNNYYLISFNGNSYDWIIVNYLFVNYHKLKSLPVTNLNERLYLISQSIIESQNTNNFHYSEYKKYIYNLPFNSIDLADFWAKLIIRNKKLSLKFFAISLDLSIIECPISWTQKYLTKEEEDIVIDYCYNDIDITHNLAHALREQINFRLKLKKQKGYDCLSWSGVKIGSESLIKDLASTNNISEKVIRDMRTYRNSVKLSDIILPTIKFETPPTGNHWKVKAKSSKKGENKFIDCFNTFSDLLIYLKTLEVKDTKSINCRVFFKDMIYDIKSGGLHSYHDSELRIREENKLYIDEDVSSYYPTLGAEQSFVPYHFIKLGLADILKRDKKDRIKDKKEGRLLDAELKKLKLNGKLPY